MGLTFDRPGRRIAKLAEVVSLIKAHWEGEELDCSGEFVQVRGYAGRPRPVQRPHPPIMIGGGGPRVLSFAGREADIVSMSSVPFVARDADGLDPHAVAQRRIDVVRAAAGERFGRPGSRELAVLHGDHRRSRSRAGRRGDVDGDLRPTCCASIPTS